MECPKCGLEIDDKAMVCPNCKKVLKLACPICKTINTSNTCKKCGYVIISKCHNCGKINQTVAQKCKKCGFDTEKSVILNDANTDNYTQISLEFPNMDDMKRLLGTAKLYNKFRVNLDKVIFDFAKSVGLRCQIYGKTYVIRCLKEYTFNGTASTAVKNCIDLINKITEMNCKLTKKKNATIRCNIILTQKNVNDDPNAIDAGFNINLLNQDTKTQETKILNTFQILADDAVSAAVANDYKITPLNSVMIKDKMVMISEIDVKSYIKIEFPVDEEEEIEVPNFVQNMLIEQDKLDGEALQKMNSGKVDPDAIYDIDTITFNEITCDFIRTENIDVIFHIMNKFQTIPKGIVAIKTQELYKPYTLKVLNAVGETGQFNNIITLTCYDEMKYTPYAFFKELVSAIFEYTVSQKLFNKNDFSMFASVDPDGLIKDLITMNKRNTENLEDTRYVYFDIFLTLLKVIPKTLIYIEDFDKIDSSSYDVMKFIFKAFEQLDISFLVSYDKNFSLHKDCHFLLMQPYYTEITLKPTSFEKMIEDNKVYYKNVLNDFYFQRIAKYACGSSLFIDLALQYLIESEVYEADEESVHMVNPKTIIIPSSLDKLVSRRINLLQDDVDAFKFLVSVVLIGTRVDMDTINDLGYANTNEIVEKLSDMGYLYQYNNCIYFPNYNLLRKNILNTANKINLQNAAKELFEKVYADNNIPSMEEAFLYGILEDKESEQKEWEELAEVNLSLGDFSAYINCVSKILELLNEIDDPDRAEEIDEKKAKLYEKISTYLYDYIPNKTVQLAQETLKNIEKTADTDKIIRLCNKMINGALSVGDYNHALELSHKVLSLLPQSSINPSDENFNKYFFLMSLIHVQILFNIGSLTDCLDVGYKVLSVVTSDNISILKPDYYTEEAFQNLITDSAGYVALANVMLMTGGIKEFINIVKTEMKFIPDSFDMFIALDDLLHGNNVSLSSFSCSDEDKFDKFIVNIVTTFTQYNGDFNKFAEFAYRAKVSAKQENMHQLELFADLLIAYAYMMVDSFEKAEHIIYEIIKETNNNGMTSTVYIAWYLMSELYLKKHKYKVAYGIVNNSIIQLEKNSTTSEYLLMLFKYAMFKVMMYRQDYQKAEICIGHAKYLTAKYGINFNFDTDAEHYVPVIDEDEEEDYTPPQQEEVESEIESEEQE